MTDGVAERLRELSIADSSETKPSTPSAARSIAVAGLDLALASLRELIGE